jgi:hypothetical protein
MFALQSTPVDGFDDIKGLDITEQFVHSRTAKVADLDHAAARRRAGLRGRIRRPVRPDLGTSQDALLTLLTAGLADPGALIDELPLTAAQQAAGLVAAVDAGSGGDVRPRIRHAELAIRARLREVRSMPVDVSFGEGDNEAGLATTW